MLLIKFASDYFFVFRLLSFFFFSHTACLGVFVLKRAATLSLKLPTIFRIDSGI